MEIERKIDKSEVKITLGTSPSNPENKIFINGEQIHRVRSIRLDAGAHEVTTLTVEIIPDIIDVTCLGDIRARYAELPNTIDDEFRHEQISNYLPHVNHAERPAQTHTQDND